MSSVNSFHATDYYEDCWYCHTNRSKDQLAKCNECSRWFCKGVQHTSEDTHNSAQSYDPIWIPERQDASVDDGVCVYCRHGQEGKIEDEAERKDLNEAILWLLDQMDLGPGGYAMYYKDYLHMDTFRLPEEMSTVKERASNGDYSSPLDLYIDMKQVEHICAVSQKYKGPKPIGKLRELREFAFKCYSALKYCYRCIPKERGPKIAAYNACNQHGLVWAWLASGQYRAGKIYNFLDDWNSPLVHVYIFWTNQKLHELPLEDCLLLSQSFPSKSKAILNEKENKVDWKATKNCRKLINYKRELKKIGFVLYYAMRNVPLTRNNIGLTKVVEVNLKESQLTTTIEKVTAPVIKHEFEDSVVQLEDNANVDETIDNLAQLDLQDQPDGTEHESAITSAIVASVDTQSVSSSSRIVLLPNFEKPKYFICASCVTANTAGSGTFEQFLEHLLDKRGNCGEHHIGVMSYEVLEISEESLGKGQYLVAAILGYHLDRARLKFRVLWVPAKDYKKTVFSDEVLAQFDQKAFQWVAATDITADMSSVYMVRRKKKIALKRHKRRGFNQDLVEFNAKIQTENKIVAVIGSNHDGSMIFVERGDMGTITVHNRNEQRNGIEVIGELTDEERAIIDRYFAGEGRSANVPTDNAS